MSFCCLSACGVGGGGKRVSIGPDAPGSPAAGSLAPPCARESPERVCPPAQAASANNRDGQLMGFMVVVLLQLADVRSRGRGELERRVRQATVQLHVVEHQSVQVVLAVRD